MHGPRVVELANGKKIVAVWNSPEELKKLYGREGFKVSGDQHQIKISTWSEAFGDCGFIGRGVYYDISINTAMVAQAEKLAIAEGIDTILGV